MGGIGVSCLRESLSRLKNQTYKDFEVVICDNSFDDSIKKCTDEFKSDLNIRYIKNHTYKFPDNLNLGIKSSRGKIIKIICQDDYLFSSDSLREIVDKFNINTDSWLVSACTHSIDGANFYNDFYPEYNSFIQYGINTIGSPSVLTIKNHCPILFDANLVWLVDCDFYKRCFEKFGLPSILNSINVVNRIGAHQMTNTRATQNLRKKELIYILKKYKNETSFLQKLKIRLGYLG
jgi:glycosyltransferase involved in cell wall biosynthesis